MPDVEEIAEYIRLRDVVARLHAPDGCPWDREQTHASLRPYLLQEAYEVLHLLDEGDIEHMPEELGDLLCQILMHTQLAERDGEWLMADVFTTLAEKLHEEVAELADAPSPDAALEELGDILFNVVNYARYLGLDAEDALRAAGHKFRRRFGGVEHLVASQGSESMKGMTRDELMVLWAKVKASE